MLISRWFMLIDHWSLNDMLDRTAVSTRDLQTTLYYIHTYTRARTYIYVHIWRDDRNWKPVSPQFRYSRGFVVLSTLRRTCLRNAAQFRNEMNCSHKTKFWCGALARYPCSACIKLTEWRQLNSIKNRRLVKMWNTELPRLIINLNCSNLFWIAVTFSYCKIQKKNSVFWMI